MTDSSSSKGPAPGPELTDEQHRLIELSAALTQSVREDLVRGMFPDATDAEVAHLVGEIGAASTTLIANLTGHLTRH